MSKIVFAGSVRYNLLELFFFLLLGKEFTNRRLLLLRIAMC
jgi:hypothetical protein